MMAGARNKAEGGRWRECLRWVVPVLGWWVGVFAVLYLWGAVFYDGPMRSGGWGNGLLGLVWLAVSAALFLRARGWWGWRGRGVALVVSAGLVLLPWSYVRPSNEREWRAEFARTGHAEVGGDVVVLYNFRNFDHGLDGGVVERWETRRVRLSRLRGLDYVQSNFQGDLLAHPILSFDFGEDGRVCLSVEARREKGEEFTPFGGVYKMFELQYLFVSEEDGIRLRTNVRKEVVRLYEVDVPLDEVREMFLSSVRVQNQLAVSPRFYNTVRANCTTSLRDQRPEGKRGGWDWRLLFNGRLDGYLYERGRLKTRGLGFAELRESAVINEAAMEAHDDGEFSRRIRGK